MHAATITPPPLPKAESRNQALMRLSQELEATFLAEMLKTAGLGKTPDSFGGGAGEDQFASFLVTEQARAMVRAGGIGLAETIYHAVKETSHDQTQA